jgi:hypothetical protein
MAKHAPSFWSRRSLRLLVVAVVVVAGLSVASLGFAQQGDPDKVLTVDNPNVSCESPVAGAKVEGNLGTTISFSADAPIDFVTVKSGEGAVVVSAQFDTHTGQITLSKDVSNYVVWTCPPTTTTEAPTTTVEQTTSSVGGVSSTRPAGGALPFTGGGSLPLLLAAVALLALGATSLLAGARRRRA